MMQISYVIDESVVVVRVYLLVDVPAQKPASCYRESVAHGSRVDTTFSLSPRGLGHD